MRRHGTAKRRGCGNEWASRDRAEGTAEPQKLLLCLSSQAQMLHMNVLSQDPTEDARHTVVFTEIG